VQEKLEKVAEYFNCVFNSIPYPEEDSKLFDSFDLTLTRKLEKEKLELLQLGLRIFLSRFDHINEPVVFENVSKYHFFVIKFLFRVEPPEIILTPIGNKFYLYCPEKWLYESRKILYSTGGPIEVSKNLMMPDLFPKLFIENKPVMTKSSKYIFISHYLAGDYIGNSQIFLLSPSILYRQYEDLRRTGSCTFIEFLSSCKKDSELLFQFVYNNIIGHHEFSSCDNYDRIETTINNYLNGLHSKFFLKALNADGFEIYSKKIFEAPPLKVPYKGYLIHFLDLYSKEMSSITKALYAHDSDRLKEELEKFKQINGEVCFASMRSLYSTGYEMYLLFYGEAEKSYPEDVYSYATKDKKTRNINIFLPKDFSKGRAERFADMDEHLCIPSKLKFIGIGFPQLPDFYPFEELLEEKGVPYINRDAGQLVDYFEQKNLSYYVMKDLDFVKRKK